MIEIDARSRRVPRRHPQLHGEVQIRQHADRSAVGRTRGGVGQAGRRVRARLHAAGRGAADHRDERRRAPTAARSVTLDQGRFGLDAASKAPQLWQVPLRIATHRRAGRDVDGQERQALFDDGQGLRPGRRQSRQGQLRARSLRRRAACGAGRELRQDGSRRPRRHARRRLCAGAAAATRNSRLCRDARRGAGRRQPARMVGRLRASSAGCRAFMPARRSASGSRR